MAVSEVVPDAIPFSSTESTNVGQGSTESNVFEDERQDLPSRRELVPCYDMSGEKILIIFNHYLYEKTRHYEDVPRTRSGTYEDVKRLEKTFRQLGFIVVTHDDWKYKDIIQYLSQVCNKDHSHTSCVAIAVMTHGRGSHVCASDRKYPVAKITHMIGTAPSLHGKPKLFFIQACRAGHTNPGGNISVDTDCLLLYASYEDYVSYRSTVTGSWLMQALCQVLDTHHHSLDLKDMVTLVNKAVADESTNGEKQTPETEYLLTKCLML